MKIFLVFVQIIITCSLLSAQTSTPPISGDGSKDNPYQITTLENLCWISETNTVWDDSAYFVQTANIDARETVNWNGGLGFSSIGNHSKKFIGIYNGKGHIISGLQIDRTSSNYIGLFGYLTKSCVDSLGLEAFSVSGQSYVGTLAGRCDTSSVSNSFCSGNITAFGNYSGGLIAYTSNTNVKTCYSLAIVTGGEYTGGLIGDLTNNSAVIDAYSAGFAQGGPSISGLVGSNYFSTIDSSYYDSTAYKNFGHPKNNYDGINGSPKTTAQLNDYNSFSSWDFNKTWAIENNSTPKLSWQISGWGTYPITAITTPIDTIQTYINGTAITYFTSAPFGNCGEIAFSSANVSVATIDSTGVLVGVSPGYATIIIASKANTSIADTVLVLVDNVFAGGSGTADNPYQIATLANLKALSELSEYWKDTLYFELTANIDASETKLWNNGRGFSSIGNATTWFTGFVNGKGHVISNLYINSPSDSYVGLFGIIASTTLDSIIVENADIIANSAVGALVGSIYNATEVKNSHSSGRITGNKYAGGLVGRSYKATVSNSSSSCIVKGSGPVGGLVGGNYSTSSVHNSYATGAVYGNGEWVGGLVGYNGTSTYIWNSFATGKVTGVSSTGGLVGFGYYSQILNSYATGSVYGTSYYCGGLIGENYSSKVYNSYAVGVVKGTACVGGLIGYNYQSQVENSYSTGYVTGIDSVGGFTGCNSNASITDSYYDKDASGFTVGIGVDDHNENVIGYTTLEMKERDSYRAWELDTNSVWGIVSGKTYPALKKVSNNTPFAFASIVHGGVVNLLDSDYDFETAQENLVMYIDSVYSFTVKKGYAYLPHIENGDSLSVVYRIGEYRPTYKDTLWGNYATSILVNNDLATSLRNKEYAEYGYSFKVAPTPTNERGKIAVVSNEEGKGSFVIYNRNEEIITSKDVEITLGKSLFEWDIISSLPEDVYFVVLNVNGKQKAITRLVKINN